MQRIAGCFEQLYGARAPRLMDRLAMLIGRYGVDAAADSAPEALWDEGDTLLITYADSLCAEGEPSLLTLRRFAEAHLADAVRIIHVLPFFPDSSDDGFSVIDYRKVLEDLGTWRDVERIGEIFDLMYDLVLNHVSARSSWFRDFERGIAPARDFFIEADPSQDYGAVVRPRSQPLLTEVQTPEGTRHVWTTFSADQVDLNFANPDVLFEFFDILFQYLTHGVRVLRLDAIAYLWKKPGTSCIHLPETHAVVKIFRDVLAMVAPRTLLLTETNVPHDQNTSYFGAGDEAHLVYQFSLPPLVLHALLRGTSRYLTQWAETLGAPGPGRTFLNFTASHDGVGVRPLEGLLPDDEVDVLVAAVRKRGGRVSTRTDGDGADRPYELNCSYFDALRPDDADDLDQHVQRFLCSQLIALAMQGIPAVYIHSLTATPNDKAACERTGAARSLNRHRWHEPDLRALLDDDAAPTSRVFEEYRRLLAIRRKQPALHPDASQTILHLGNAVFGMVRTNERTGDRLVHVANMTHHVVKLDAGKGGIDLATSGWCDVLSNDAGNGPITLPPYQTRWLVAGRK